jgi:hypothetical protein
MFHDYNQIVNIHWVLKSYKPPEISTNVNIYSSQKIKLPPFRFLLLEATKLCLEQQTTCAGYIWLFLISQHNTQLSGSVSKEKYFFFVDYLL